MLVASIRRLLWIDEKLVALTDVPVSELNSDTAGDVVVSMSSIHDGSRIIDDEKGVLAFIRKQIWPDKQVIIYDAITRTYEWWKVSLEDNVVAISDHTIFCSKIRELLNITQ